MFRIGVVMPERAPSVEDALQGWIGMQLGRAVRLTPLGALDPEEELVIYLTPERRLELFTYDSTLGADDERTLALERADAGV